MLTRKILPFVFVGVLLMIVMPDSFVLTQHNCTPYHTIIDDPNSTLVMYQMETDTLLSVNPRRAMQRFAPYSTFKVFNAMVALETGVMTDVESRLEYDASVYPLNDLPDTVLFNHWREPHNLRTGMRYSVVWFYTEVARMIGQEQMQFYLDEIGYGNANASAWIEERQFWLGNGLEISAYEQVNFLRRMLDYDLPVARSTLDSLRDILVLEHTDSYTVSGKTGTALAGGVSWFIGYVEHEDQTTVFALNTDGGTHLRDAMVEAIVSQILACM